MMSLTCYTITSRSSVVFYLDVTSCIEQVADIYTYIYNVYHISMIYIDQLAYKSDHASDHGDF